MIDSNHELFWDATYAIAMALLAYYPDRRPEDVGLHEMADMIEQLPGFCDDPALANDEILLDIQTTWYEESINE
ncbi:MAG TPA: Fe-S cluster assembly protein IscX [Anaerolineae bacterium]|nr:Fe-S cluster assembly protein IscX [Anaerolineae bacterium]